MNLIGCIITVAILVAILGAIFIYTGTYDVAASHPDPPFVRAILNATSDRSIETHAKPVPGMPELSDALAAQGFSAFDQTCRLCHGAPGIEPEPFADGLYPKAPELSESTDLNPAELFWIIKNGIKMTAMPSFAPTYRDDEIWPIVAFVRRLPGINRDEYLGERARAQYHVQHMR